MKSPGPEPDTLKNASAVGSGESPRPAVCQLSCRKSPANDFCQHDRTISFSSSPPRRVPAQEPMSDPQNSPKPSLAVILLLHPMACFAAVIEFVDLLQV